MAAIYKKRHNISDSENQNVEILIERCPVSFEKFYEDYTGILNSEDMDKSGIE